MTLATDGPMQRLMPIDEVATIGLVKTNMR